MADTEANLGVRITRFALASILFPLLWLAFDFFTIRRWNAASVDARFWRVYLALIFVLLWTALQREKTSTSCLLIAYLALLAAFGAVFL